MIASNPSLNELISSANAAFLSWMGEKPCWRAAAPGRVNLIGEHTDYNDGWVLPLAIDLYTVMVAAPSSGAESIRVRSLALDEDAIFAVNPLTPLANPHWARYLQGVVHEYAELGVFARPMDVLIASSIPVGGGLSSSAAIELAMAKLIEVMSSRELSPMQRVKAARRAEKLYAGVPCGIMDQFAVAQGLSDHALLIDCKALGACPIPFNHSDLALLIFDSGVQHDLSEGEYARRRAECKQAVLEMSLSSLRDINESDFNKLESDNVSYRRTRHVFGENKRVLAATQALYEKNYKKLGKLLTESHKSLRDDYEVSCFELDILVDLAANEADVYGAKMTGGGFGGCVIVLSDWHAKEAVVRSIQTQYAKATGIFPPCLNVCAVAGADNIELKG